MKLLIDLSPTEWFWTPSLNRTTRSACFMWGIVFVLIEKSGTFGARIDFNWNGR